MTEITDADREAAVSLARTLFDGEYNPVIIEGQFEQAFAKHREEATRKLVGALQAAYAIVTAHVDVNALGSAGEPMNEWPILHEYLQNWHDLLAKHGASQ